MRRKAGVGVRHGCSQILKRFSEKIISLLEDGMYRLGIQIAKYPFAFIVVIGLISTLSAIGMVKFHFETGFIDLWVPTDSEIRENIGWIDDNFPSSSATRGAEFIATAENVLTPAVVKAMLDVHLKIMAINESGNWETHCLRLYDICYSRSLLELWSFSRDEIDSLSEQSILNRINEKNLTSPVFFKSINIDSILGGTVRDEKGNILKARAAALGYLLDTKGSPEKVIGIEDEFVQIGLSENTNFDQTYVFTESSYVSESQKELIKDIPIAATAFIPIFFYLIFMLGKFNSLQNKMYLSLAGVLCVCLSLLSSFGFCSFMGYFYGNLHSMIVFIILGIGVDDMFVIVQTLENICKERPDSELKEKIGHTLKHVGVSITVTSLTDAVSFSVGAVSSLPAIRSFSLYCGIAVLFLFAYNVTFFMAFVVLDARRVEERRDALLCCIQYSDDYQPHECSQRNYLQTFFTNIYAPNLLRFPTKVIVLLITATLFGVGCYGTHEILGLNKGSSIRKYLPSDSYLSLYYDAKEQYFPAKNGEEIVLYLGGVDYYEEQETVSQLYDDLDDCKYVQSGTIRSWFKEFEAWTSTEKSEESEFENETLILSENGFYTCLQEFLYLSSVGINFAEDVQLYPSGSGIYASRIDFNLIQLTTIDEEIDAMDSVRDIAKDAAFVWENASSFTYSGAFLHWGANKIVKQDIVRNLGVLTATVFVVVLLLVVNLQCSFLVLACVIITLVDIIGLMYFWGLAIDTVTSGVVILAVGLSIDYSVHIAIAFMKASGKSGRAERTKKALSSIAPAVFNAGFSSLVALLPLVSTTSYVFITLFRVIFFMTVLGLFHGIVFLPVILSWFGPESYYAEDDSKMDINPVSQGHVEVGQINSIFIDIPLPSEPVKSKSKTKEDLGLIFPNDSDIPPFFR